MVPCPESPLTPSPLTPCPSPQETLKVCLHPHIMMFHPMFMVPCPETPLTPSPLTPCPSPQETLKVCLYPNIMMFHPMFMVPCPEAPLTPSPLTPCPSPQETLKVWVCAYVHGPVPRVPPNPKSPDPLSQPPRNPKGVLAPTHHDVPPYVHGPVPRGPPNPKPPNPLSQPPRNPKGVLVPKHHDVPPTHHFFLFFKGCTATSDGILASRLWLLQVTEFLVSQVTCPPFKVPATNSPKNCWYRSY